MHEGRNSVVAGGFLQQLASRGHLFHLFVRQRHETVNIILVLDDQFLVSQQKSHGFETAAVSGEWHLSGCEMM